jgi:DNA-binding response OmpR family regulator
MLSGDDGRDICREIKKLNSGMKVILLSANNHLLMNSDGCGADTLIEKPFSLKNVLTKIDALLVKAA